jgi:hypothetical protein
LDKWRKKYPKNCDRVEEYTEETSTSYRLPLQHHKHLKSTNMLERINAAPRLPTASADSTTTGPHAILQNVTHITRLGPLERENCRSGRRRTNTKSGTLRGNVITNVPGSGNEIVGGSR